MLALKRMSWVAVVAGLAVFLTGSGIFNQASTEAAITTIEVGLSGDEENPPVRGSATASARLVFDDATRKLDYALTVSGLSADLVTAAHIHRGPVGVNGPIIHTLSATGFTQISGSVTLSEAEVADLRAGNLYLNVHSKENPSGFARGQIFLSVSDAIQSTINKAIAAWNNGDAETFISFWTDAGLESVFEVSRDEAEEELSNFIGSSPLTFRSLTNLQVTGRTATGVLELLNGNVIERTQDTFVLDGIWKIADETILSVPIPSGTTAVDVEMREFSFVYDRNAVTSNVAFRTRNTGAQFHELALAKLNSTRTLQEILMSEGDGPPADVQMMGVVYAAPGQNADMVLASPLAAGRYAFVCFIPDTDGVPHAIKGMVSEFTIGGGGSSAGGGIRPPSTGDAGLADARGSYLMLVGIALISLGGIGSVALARSRA